VLIVSSDTKFFPSHAELSRQCGCVKLQRLLGRIPELLMDWKRCATTITVLIKRLITTEVLPLEFCKDVHASDFAALHN
jgi:hypothetical protein